VAIKVNLTGGNRFEGYTAGDTHWVHPKVVGAVTAVFGKLGAKRVRILESANGRRPNAKLEDKLLSGGWTFRPSRTPPLWWSSKTPTARRASSTPP